MDDTNQLCSGSPLPNKTPKGSIDAIKGLKFYLHSKKVLIIAADAMAAVPSSNSGLEGLIFRMHGILLRQLEKVRIICAIGAATPGHLENTCRY